MKNYEKYADEIKTYTNGPSYCEEIIIPNVLKPLGKSCVDTSCDVCNALTTLWLMEEYEEPEEPEVDWSKVEVDTPVLVRGCEKEEWKKMHFAECILNTVYVWEGGKTSWTTDNTYPWEYAKLAEDQKEPEIDWNKVEVDTPILVKNSENTEWLKKYFAKYENGLVYVWFLGRTSWTAPHDKSVSAWKYAKLVESEEE